MIWSIWAQFNVQGAFARNSEIPSQSGQTGFTTARRLLDQNGLFDVDVELSRGHLSDHYDPRDKTVRLSRDVYHGTSLAALAVSAHEVGHAVQDATGYKPLKIRQVIIRTTRLVNVVLLPLIIVGMLGMFFMPFFLGGNFFFWFIIAMTVMYGMTALVQLITLPTEFDASRRAKQMLKQDGVINDPEEMEGVSQTLRAAALTYVAGLAVSLVFFLRFLMFVLMLTRGRR